MSDQQQERLSRTTKLMYGAGDLGFAVTGSIISILFAIHLTDVVGLDPGLAAAAIFVGRSWDYINDPLIGYLSDRTRTRWGRRRPFLLFGWLPFALAFAALWWKPPIANQLGLAVYYAIIYLFYDAAATLTYMPYFALTPELTLDYDERTSLTSYRMAFSILGSLIAFTLPLTLIGTMRPENAGRVSTMGLLFGLCAGLPLLLTFFGTRERPQFQTQVQPGLRESLRAAFRNRPFLFAAGLFLFTWTAVEIVEGMLLYFLKYRLLLEKESDLISATIFISALITLPVWDRISRLSDKRRAYIWGMLSLSAVMITMIVATPEWPLALLFALAGLAGIGVGAVHVLPWAIMPDAVEWDEAQTGQRHEGMFYSLVVLMRKIASSVALPLMLLVLKSSGYTSNAAVQPLRTQRAIQVLTGLVPSLLLGAGILFALFYPLGRQGHAELRAIIAAREAEKQGE